MAFDFATVLKSWESIGVFDVLLPFLLIFTITFAVLEKSKILGEKRNINVAISLVASLLFVRNTYLVDLVNRFLPNVSLFMVIIIMFLLLIGVFGGGSAWSGGLLGVAAIVSVVFVIWAVSADVVGDNFAGIPDWWTSVSDEAKATIVFLGVFILIIWLVTKDKKDKGSGGGLGKLLKEIGDGVKGN